MSVISAAIAKLSLSIQVLKRFIYSNPRVGIFAQKKQIYSIRRVRKKSLEFTIYNFNKFAYIFYRAMHVVLSSVMLLRVSPSVCLSVRLSVALVTSSRIGWDNSKIITRIISLRVFAPDSPNIVQQEHPKIRVE